MIKDFLSARQRGCTYGPARSRAFQWQHDKRLQRRSSVIQEVSGDILLSRAAVIAHGVSPNDDFHLGLAHALRE